MAKKATTGPAPAAISFEEVRNRYNELSLPADFYLNQAFPQLNWKGRELNGAALALVAGPGKIELKENEQAFAGHRFLVSAQITALVTYVMGDTRECYIVHTHDASGAFKSQLVVWLVDESLDYGYASEITPDMRVTRGTMKDMEGGGQDAVEEEHFEIEPEGKIVQLK